MRDLENDCNDCQEMLKDRDDEERSGGGGALACANTPAGGEEETEERVLAEMLRGYAGDGKAAHRSGASE